MKVRDILKAIEADGWREVSQEGSHRQFKHPVKKAALRLPESRDTSRPQAQ